MHTYIHTKKNLSINIPPSAKAPWGVRILPRNLDHGSRSYLNLKHDVYSAERRVSRPNNHWHFTLHDLNLYIPPVTLLLFFPFLLSRNIVIINIIPIMILPLPSPKERAHEV